MVNDLDYRGIEFPVSNNNWVFIDRMQFMNSSLDSLVKNLSDSDF